MSAVINTNLASLFAQNSLAGAQSNLATSVQRLSSGLRINSSKDDASGLAIAQNMQGQINAINFASQNASQATNMAQTADTAMGTVQDILLRMKQLSVEGSNSSISNAQQLDVVTELNTLTSQIDNIANGTTYNGLSLLNDTSSTAYKFQVGQSSALTSDTFTFTAQDFTQGASGVMNGVSTALTALASPTSPTSFALFQTLSTQIDSAIEGVSTKRAVLGSQMNSLGFVAQNLQSQSANLQASRSTVIDTDFSAETAKLTKGQIMQQAATAMLAQANQMPNVILSLLK
jgi:flagellin